MVHLYSMNGYNFAIDGNNGSIHILDDLCYQVLEMIKESKSVDIIIDNLKLNYSSEEIKEAYNEIMELKEQDLLFSDDINDKDIIEKLDSNKSIKALCLHVAHDCNLGCEYCFASKGDYKSGRSIMSKDVALKAVDYLLKNSGKRQNIEIDFFGGEPLLNFDVVKDVVAYGREIEKNTDKKFYFTITTNGTLLNDDIINFVNENMDNIVISIDGRKETHDSVRYDKNGNGSYDKIVPSAIKLVNQRGNKSYFIRGTFTSKNLNFSKDVMHLADLGFKEISVEPVVGEGEDIFIKEKDIPIVLKEYDKLSQEYLSRINEGKGFRFYHFNLELYKGPCIIKRIIGCGSGFEYLAVSPEGKLYPCHQFVGEDDYIIGDIYNGIENKDLSNKFKNNNILKKETCKNCWAKLFCSGGCHANAYYSSGNISTPNELACILQKKRIECAIMIQAVLHSEKTM